MRYILTETFLELLDKNETRDEYLSELGDVAIDLALKGEKSFIDIVDLKNINRYFEVTLELKKSRISGAGVKIKANITAVLELTADEYADLYMEYNPDSRKAYKKLKAMLK